MDLDAKHNAAIRDEIADRLRTRLEREQSAVPPRLRQLLRHLDAPDPAHDASPSLVPEIPAEPGRSSKAQPAAGWLHWLLRRSR